MEMKDEASVINIGEFNRIKILDYYCYFKVNYFYIIQL